MKIRQMLPRRSWANCLCSTFLFVLLFAEPSFGQDTNASNQKVADAINAFIGSKDFKVTTLNYSNENGEKKATGAIEMWGIPGIQLDAVVTGEDTTVKEITLSFPSASNLSIGKLNGVTGGVLTSYLPSGFPLEAGASLNSIGLKLNGSSLSECSVLFGTAEAWRILGSDAVALNQISTEFIVENPRNAESRKFTGNITAKCALGDALINLTASLTQNKEEISFTGEFNNIGIENLLNAVSDVEQGAGIVELIPAQIRSLKADKVSLSIWPMGKRASCYATSAWGDFELQVQGLGSTSKLILAVSPPTSFSFSDLSPALGVLDGIDMSGTSLIISSHTGEVETRLRAFESADGKTKVIKGINVVSQVTLGSELEKILKTQSLVLTGNVGSDLKSANLECAVQFVDLGNDDFQFKNVAFGFSVAPANFELFFKGVMEVNIDNDIISFTTELKGSPIDLDLQGSLYLQALQKAQQARQEASANNKPYWEQPFGVPYVAIGGLGGAIGVSPKSPIALSSLGLFGDVRLGSVADRNRHIQGTLAVSLDIANPGNSLFEVDVRNLTLVKAIEAFSDAPVSGSLRTALDWGFESAHVYIVPVAQTFLGKQYDQGVAIEGTMKIAGLGATCSFRANTSGVSVMGTVDGVNIETGGFKIFSLSGASGSGDPLFSMNLDKTDPRLKVDGSITVLGVTSTSYIDISKSGFTYQSSGKIFGGGLEANLTLSAPSFSFDEGLYVKASVSATILQDISKQLSAFIEAEHKKNAADIKAAENTLANTKGANSFEQAFIDGAESVVSAAGEMERAAAVIGTYISDGILGQSIVVDELSFESAVNSVTASMNFRIKMTIAGSKLDETLSLNVNVANLSDIVSQIFEQIGDDIENVFGQLANEVTNGYETFVQDAEVFFGDVEEGFAQMGDEIMSGINYIGEQLNINFNREGDYDALPGPSNGSRPARLAPALTRFNVRVASIQCTGCQDAVLYPSCEFYGNVIISTNINGSTQNFGSNQYLYKGDHEDIDAGNMMSNGGPQKDIYIPDNQLSSAYITVVADFWEDDDGWDDEQVSARTSFFVGNISPGETRGGDQLYVTAGSSSNQILIRFSIHRESKPSGDQMLAAARAGLTNELSHLATQGGNLLTPGIVAAAIESRSYATLEFLYNEGNRFNANDLSYALQSQNLNLDLVGIMLNRGTYPQVEHMNQAVASRNVALVNLFLDHHAAATVDQMRMAMNNNDRECAKALMRNGMVVPSDIVQTAIDRNDIELVTLFAGSGSLFTQAQLHQAVKSGNNALIDQVLRRTVPDHAALQLAAQANNKDLFSKLCSKGARLSDNAPTQSAIANNSIEIFKLCLQNGAEPTEALKYVSDANKEISWVHECLKQNANPDYAINYAVRNNQKALVNQLLEKGATPQLLLSNSVEMQHLEFTTLALQKEAAAGPAVLRAAQLESEPILKLLIENGGNPNDAMTPVVNKNNVGMTRYLLDNGASANDPYYVRKACESGSLDMVNVLCEYGADANHGMADAIRIANAPIVRTLLTYGASPSGHLATPASLNQIEIAQALLEFGANPNEGLTPAVGGNHTPMVKMLLDFGASPAGQLNTACLNNNLDIVKLLLIAGADSNEGMQGAMTVNNTEMARVLLEYGASPHGYMHVPAAKGNLDIVLMLLDAGANANEGLAAAISGNHNSVVQLLLQRGANVQTGMLNEPAGRGNLEMVTMLVDAGANPEEGMPPAVNAGHTPVVSFLIGRGADGSKQEYLITAVGHDYFSMIPVLINAGGNKDYKDANGNSFLHITAQNKFLSSFLELVKAGCDINVKNNEGNTVLHMAARQGKRNLAMVTQAVELGADVNAVNNKGQTVRRYAKSHKVKKYLKSKGALRKIKPVKAN